MNPRRRQRSKRVTTTKRSDPIPSDRGPAGSAIRIVDDHAPPGFANPRSWTLAFFALVLLIVSYSPPDNYRWLARVVRYYGMVPYQLRNMDPLERQLAHLGRNFLVLQEIDKQLGDDDVFLLPPASYARRVFDPVHWHWTEPKYFYYFLGRRKTVTLDSEDIRSATRTALLRPGGMVRIVDLRPPGALEAALSIFEGSQP